MFTYGEQIYETPKGGNLMFTYGEQIYAMKGVDMDNKKREAQFLNIPTMKNERQYGFGDAALVNSGWAIATWCFLTGGLKMCIRDSITYAHRMADEAERRASECADEKRRQELLTIAENCRVVPENPPKTFQQALQAVSNNLWQRPTFPHDVMQYHRRWRA